MAVVTDHHRTRQAAVRLEHVRPGDRGSVLDPGRLRRAGHRRALRRSAVGLVPGDRQAAARAAGHRPRPRPVRVRLLLRRQRHRAGRRLLGRLPELVVVRAAERVDQRVPGGDGRDPVVAAAARGRRRAPRRGAAERVRHRARHHRRRADRGHRPAPWWVYGSLSVELDLPWPLPNVGGTVSLSWGGNGPPPPAPLALVTVDATLVDHGASDQLRAARPPRPAPVNAANAADTVVYDSHPKAPGILDAEAARLLDGASIPAPTCPGPDRRAPRPRSRRRSPARRWCRRTATSP